MHVHTHTHSNAPHIHTRTVSHVRRVCTYKLCITHKQKIKLRGVYKKTYRLIETILYMNNNSRR